VSEGAEALLGAVAGEWRTLWVLRDAEVEEAHEDVLREVAAGASTGSSVCPSPPPLGGGGGYLSSAPG